MNTSDQDKQHETVRRGKSKKTKIAQAVGGTALVASLVFGGASLLPNSATPTYAQTATQAATPSSSSGTTNTAPQTQATPSGTPSSGTNDSDSTQPGGRSKGGAGGFGHGGPGGGLSGTISAISGNTITVKRGTVVVIEATVNSSTVYKDAGTTINLGDLKVGEQVAVRESRATDGTTSIAEVDVVYNHTSGTISATASDSLTITKSDNTTQKISLSSSSTYTDLSKTISLSDLKSGVKVEVEGTLNSDGSLSAKSVQVQHDRLGGTVTSVSGNTITVQVGGPGKAGGFGGRGPQGQNGTAPSGNAAPSTGTATPSAGNGSTTAPTATTKTITVSNGTVYLASGQSAKLSDIAVGSRINAEGTISSDGNSLTALQVTISMPSYRGQVTAVSGNTITLSDRGGTKTVVVDSNTKYLNGTATASLSDVKTGVTVEAQGKLDSSGKLTATVIQLGQPQGGPKGGDR